MITPLTDAYENEIKPWREGYSTANYNTMQYNGVNISQDLILLLRRRNVAIVFSFTVPHVCHGEISGIISLQNQGIIPTLAV